MSSRFAGILVLLAIAALLAAPVAASPAPVTGCPPCDRGFVHGAQSHGLETDVSNGEATVRVHRNGSATWTVRVVPTNAAVLHRLATNQTLARAVARDSFGTRYGGGIEHELLDAAVEGDALVIRYRTLDVGRAGPLGTEVFTYFRDSPGAWVYTDLGADRVTVVAPPETTVARGFGDVGGDRLVATRLPDVRNGPFVVFAPEGSVAPGLLGAVAVLDALGGVIVRNLALFVALPGGVIVGGLAAVRRFVPTDRGWNPTLAGGLVAAAGALLAVAFTAGRWGLPVVAGNPPSGSVAGAVLLALGVAVAHPDVRRYLTPVRLVATGVLLVLASVVSSDVLFGVGGLHGLAAAAMALLPVAVALGWADADGTDRVRADRLFYGVAIAVVLGLLVVAPLTDLGGSLFLLAPVLLAIAAAGIVVVSVPLYLLGAAGAG